MRAWFQLLQFPRQMSWLESQPDALVRRLFLFGLLALFILRVAFIAFVPFDLSGDEAYYWAWGRHPAWGYLSKPPGIAWIMALLRFLGVDSTLGIRLTALGLGTAGLGLFFWMGCRMYDVRTGLVAALVFALTPANAVLNFVLTIDVPLMLFWTGAIWVFWEFLQSGGRSGGWALGLAGFLSAALLTKQMALLFYPLAILLFIASPDHRQILRSTWFWIAIFLPLLALMPTLLWNREHHWVTFAHSAHHFETGSPTSWVRIARFFEFAGAGLGLLTPLICLLMMLVVIGVISHWKSLPSRERFLWIFGGLGLVVMTLLTFRQRVNGNWPGIFVPGGLLLVTGWYFRHWSVGVRWVDRCRKGFLPGIAMAFGIMVVFYLLVPIFTLEILRDSRLNPVRRLQNWSRLAGEFGDVHASLPDPGNTIFLTQGHRDMPSELSFYLPGRPHVFPYLPVFATADSQYALWKLPEGALGKDALIVVYDNEPALDSEFAACFTSVSLLKKFDPSESPSTRFQVALYLGRNLRSWPKTCR